VDPLDVLLACPLLVDETPVELPLVLVVPLVDPLPLPEEVLLEWPELV
jgi:hypothetical protein